MIGQHFMIVMLSYKKCHVMQAQKDEELRLPQHPFIPLPPMCAIKFITMGALRYVCGFIVIVVRFNVIVTTTALDSSNTRALKVS